MTQEQALQAYREMFPEKAEYLEANRAKSIGYRNLSEFTFWDWSYKADQSVSNRRSDLGMIQSKVSWEHALTLARADQSLFAKDESPVEDAPIDPSGAGINGGVVPRWVTA